jgi:Spy/CpxP family protein refolding chaperone
MSSNFMKAGLTLALAGALSVLTFAQTPAPQTGAPGPGGPERHGRHDGGFGEAERGGGFEERALSQLNLTDAQKQQIAALRQRYAENTKPQRDQLRQLFAARQQGTLTADQETQAQQLHTQLRESNEKLHAELLAVLTPEQRDQLKQLHEQFKQQMQERRAHHNDAQPGTQPNN